MPKHIIAGHAPGGLKETYEVKILVCYLLSVVGTALTFESIAEVCMADGVTDYFTLTTAMGELKESGQVFEGGAAFALTGLGRETAENLRQALPSSLRDNLVRRGMALLAKLRKQNEVTADIRADGKGFRVLCSVHEGALDFFTMTFYAPDREQAQIIAQNFYNHSTEIYQNLIQTLTE